MKQNDLTEFQNIMLGMFETFGQETSTTRINIYKEALKPYEILDIRRALNILIRRSKFIPKPAEIIELIDNASGNAHMESSEAWAIALSADDESNTVIWTDEMHKAWVIAKNVMDIGDEVGARRAFIEAYERLVREAVIQGKKINVTVSLGFDKAKRTQVINRAIFTGLLSQNEGDRYLPKPENTFAMLENKAKKVTQANGVPQALLKIKQQINAQKEQRKAEWEIEKKHLHDSLKARYEQELQEVAANG